MSDASTPSPAVQSAAMTLIAQYGDDAEVIAVMRAAERIGDELLKQQLLNVIHRMNLDAAQLRNAREEIAGQELKRA